jgi:hypothetical protein
MFDILPIEIHFHILIFADVYDLINLISLSSIIKDVVLSFIGSKKTIAAAFAEFCKQSKIPLIQLDSSKAKPRFKYCKKYKRLIFCHHSDSSAPIVVDTSSNKHLAKKFKYKCHFQIRYFKDEKTIIFFNKSNHNSIYFKHQFESNHSSKIEKFDKKIKQIQRYETYNIKFNCYQPKEYNLRFSPFEKEYFFSISSSFKKLRINCPAVKILKIQQVTPSCVQIVFFSGYLGCNSRISECLIDFASETAQHLKHYESEFQLYEESCLLLDNVLFCQRLKPIKMEETKIDQDYFEFSFV